MWLNRCIMKEKIMMTKKSEMAEWILDFFRRAKVAAGQIVMFRNLQFAQQQLNPKERSLFLNVMNELLEHGYFTFEQEPLQCLRLSEKGYEYIYDETAFLDCCNDPILTSTQTQYLASWHKSFTEYIASLKTFVITLMQNNGVSDEDKSGFQRCLHILEGKEVHDVERALSEGRVTNTTLDEIEKINKDLVDIALDHIKTEELAKMFLKNLFYVKIGQEKKSERMRLGKLNIDL